MRRNRCSAWRATRIFGALAIFQFVGTTVVLLCERLHYAETENGGVVEPAAAAHRALKQNRTALIDELIDAMFNNTEFLFFLTAEQSKKVQK